MSRPSRHSTIPKNLVSKSSQQTEKKIPTDESNHTEKKLTFSFQNTMTFFSLLIAIGAYSKDSLFVDFWKSEDVYSIVKSASFNIGPIFYTIRETPSEGTTINMIPIILNVTIRNNSSDEQIIAAIKVEVLDDRKQWRMMSHVAIDNGMFAAMNNDIKRSQLVRFEGGNLKKILGKEILKSKDVLSGWLYLDPPKDIPLENFLNRQLRITFYSGFGESETHKLEQQKIDSVNNRTRDISMFKTDTIKDFSMLPIIRQNDILTNVFKNK